LCFEGVNGVTNDGRAEEHKDVGANEGDHADDVILFVSNEVIPDYFNLGVQGG
jgi:hypothetical protein